MLISFLHHFGIWILIIVSLPFGHLQQVTIQRLEGNQGPVCPGQQISFQCTTVGSAVIAWRSTDFIGSNIVQIGFFDNEPLNTPKMSMAFPDTVAVLASKGSGVLTSTLTVTVTSMNLNPSVTCINDDHSTETTFSFHVIGVPGVPTIDENPVLWENTQGCLLSISWMAVANVSHYIVSINATHDINETLSTITSVVVPECRSYGVRVRSVNQCGDKSPYSPEILSDTENIRPLISFNSPDSFTTDDASVCTNPPREVCVCPSTISVPVIIIAVILLVAALVLIATAALIIWCTIKPKKDSKDKSNDHYSNSAKNEVVQVTNTGSQPSHTDSEITDDKM